MPLLGMVLGWGCSSDKRDSQDVTDGSGPAVITDAVDSEGDALPSGREEVAADLHNLYDPEACDPRLLPPGQVRAKPIVCEEELPGGPKAIGRVGDYLLENNRVRFVVRAETGHTFVGMDGGNVVDADLARTPGAEGEDSLQEIIPLFSFNSAALESLEITHNGQSGEAVVSAQGPAEGVPYLVSLIPILPVLDGIITHEYLLKADSNTLILRTRISWNGDPGNNSVMPIDGFFASGALDGFAVGNLGGEEPLPALVSHRPGISYGFLGSKGYAMTSFGAVALATGSSVPVGADGQLVVERFLVVGDGSVSAITDELARLRGLDMGAIEGCVEPADQALADGVEVVAVAEDGNEVTRFRVDELGCFSGALPPGTILLHTVCPGCDPGQETSVEVTGGDSVTGNVMVPSREASGIQVTVSGEDGGAIPARLTVQPADGGETLTFFAWPPERHLPLPPGTYDVFASRGFEYEQAVLENVEVQTGDSVLLAFELERSVDTPGAVAAEFHIHSENSVDSFVPLPQRVRSIAAEGIEFAVASEHDFVADFGPTIESENLAQFLAASPGVEVSSVQAGHMNCWPMESQPDLSGNGALAWFGLPPGTLVDALAKDNSERVIVVNHPRFQNESTFDLIDFDPADGLAHADPEQLGFPADTDLNQLHFDAMEVFNGIGDEDLDEQLADWYALLNLGRTIAATAGGDSHTLDAFPGNPRNLLFLGQDDPALLTVEAVNEAVRNQRVLVTSGPYVEAGLTSESTGAPSLPGDLVSGVGGDIELWIKVQAPTWMEVTEVVVIRNGVAEQVLAIDDPGEPELREVVRFDQSVPVQADADCWFVVRVQGTQKAPNLANHIPRAITNPFYLDADGNGQFDAPGL